MMTFELWSKNDIIKIDPGEKSNLCILNSYQTFHLCLGFFSSISGAFLRSKMQEVYNE